jgi:FkbM family methyltransferase
MKLGKFVQWHTAVGTRSDEMLRQINTLLQRFETFSRLHAQNLEISTEIASSWRRELAQQAGMQETILERIGQVMNAHADRISQVQGALDGIRQAMNVHADRISQVQGALDGIRHAMSDGHIRVNPAFAYLGEWIGLATTVNGNRLFIDTRDRQIAPHLATVGLWESWNQRIFQRILTEGDVVVEVGSNVGYFALLAGQLVGASGKVYSHEANPSIAPLLEASAEINGFADRIKVSQIAISDVTGQGQFTIYDAHHGDGHLVGNQPVHNHSGAHTIGVNTDTLDNLLSDQSDVRLLHLDVEGAEPMVLRGAKGLIARSPKLVVLMEWGLGTRGRGEELDWLGEQGFTFHVVEHDGGFTPVTAQGLRSRGLCDVICYRGSLSELGLSAPAT